MAGRGARLPVARICQESALAMAMTKVGSAAALEYFADHVLNEQE
jgi:hypothetical protein